MVHGCTTMNINNFLNYSRAKSKLFLQTKNNGFIYMDKTGKFTGI